MISLSARRPNQLGQFSSFVNPFEVTGETTPMTPPSAAPSPAAQDLGIIKPVAVLTGLALTGLSAATAYVGIDYGTDKKNSDLKRALGWTVGVIGALSGLVRLAGTTALLFIPTEPKRSPPLA